MLVHGSKMGFIITCREKMNLLAWGLLRKLEGAGVTIRVIIRGYCEKGGFSFQGMTLNRYRERQRQQTLI